MQIFLVGGAVRDQLLGLPVVEHDWVVIGSTVEEMITQGYQPVGKSFPVFLHPTSKEEYALARTEKKIAKGYQGFEFYTNPSVTLEEDLARRDLTINAIAQAPDGKLIDPFNGQKDLQQKVFRHVSEAFAEDPVRILRLARFAARFGDFSIHPETLSLMQSMVKDGEVDALVAERVWKECAAALTYQHPEQFFLTLEKVGCLQRLFQIDYDLTSCLQHLQKACERSPNPVIRWAAWHANTSAEDYLALNRRFRLPKQVSNLAAKIIQLKDDYLQLVKHTAAEALLQLITKLGALKSIDFLKDFHTVCQTLTADDLTPWFIQLESLVLRLQHIKTDDLQAANLTGLEFAKKLAEKRLNTTQQWMIENDR